jgi:hypothetical protein
VVWADPELDAGADDDAFTEVELLVPVLVPLLVPVLVPVAVACDLAVEPGRVTAKAPAATSPAAPTEMVAARRAARPRRRAATAGRGSSLRLFIESPLAEVRQVQCSAGPCAAPRQNL